MEKEKISRALCKLSLSVVLMTRILPVNASASQPSSLRRMAARIGLLVGTAVNPAFFSNPEYAGTLARQFDMVEPENVMKWRTTEPAEGVFNFRPGDLVVAFARAHHMKVRGHNLLWSIYNPAWLTGGHFTPAQLRSIMKTHILMEVRHYRGAVFAWDVVNEAFDRRGRLKHSIWYDQPGIGLAGRGTAYIAQAFRWARQADPRALLFYNDYQAEGINAKSNAIYAMVKDFKRRGIPIDGVGLQMHLPVSRSVPPCLAANITRLVKLGVQVQVTEMDVWLPLSGRQQVTGRQLAAQAEIHRRVARICAENPDCTFQIRQQVIKRQFAAQAKIYRRVARICAENPGCTAFQTWGFTDRHSWVPHFLKGQGDALIFDAAYQPKPAYHAVFAAFRRTWKANPAIRDQRLRFFRQTAARRK